MPGEWLCPVYLKAIGGAECTSAECGINKKKCPVFIAFVKEKSPQIWEKKMGIWNRIAISLLSNSMKILDRDKEIDFQHMREEYSLCKNLVVELNINDAHFRAYFLIQDGHPTMLQDTEVRQIDAVLITTFGVLKKLFEGTCTVYDYGKKAWIQREFTPEYAYSWNLLNLVKISKDKDVLSSAYLFSKRLYQEAFPIIKKHMQAKGLLK